MQFAKPTYVLFAAALLTASESYYIQEQIIFSRVKLLFEITIRMGNISWVRLLGHVQTNCVPV